MGRVVVHPLLSRLLPFLRWFPLSRAGLRADLVAGITVALVLVPQSMAYAQLAGLPPHYGLYASFMVPIIAAIFGSSKQLQNGPVAVISLMTAAALAPLGLTVEQTVMYAALLALLAVKFLKEKVSPVQGIGIGVITCGLVLIGVSG